MTSYASGDAKWVFDSVVVTPGASYVYRDYYKSNTSTKLVAAYERIDGTKAYETLKTLPASVQWTATSVSLTVPANVRRMSVFHLIASVGTLQLDDVSLTAPMLADLSSGVGNGSLEQPSDADPSLPHAWRPSSWGTNQPTFTYATFGRSGSRSVQLTVTGYANGDAKWVFDPQPVSAGQRYQYSDFYIANTDSFIIVEIRLSDGSVQYLNLGNVPASRTFTPANAAFTAPEGAVSATVFHGLKKNGSLTIDDVGLAALSAAALVDGVPSGDLEQPAFPGANAPAGWYTNVYGTNDAVFSYPREGHTGARSLRVDIRSYTSGRAGWYFDAQPVTPKGSYRLSHYYRSNVDTTVFARVQLASGAMEDLQLPPAFAALDWTKYAAIAFLPTDAARVTILHQLGSVGYLQTDDYSFQPATNAPLRRALVSLTFDDSWRTDYDNAFPVLRDHSAVATHYVLTGYLGRPDRMTESMLMELDEYGSEIASHTVSHPDLTTLTATELERELAEPKPILEALGVGPILNFATPYGAYNATASAAIARQYQSHRTTDVGYNTKDNFNIQALKVQNIRSTTTASEVDGWATQAAADRSWLILVYHDVIDPPNSIYGTTPSNLDAHLTVLESRDLPIVTVQQALTEIIPQL